MESATLKRACSAMLARRSDERFLCGFSMRPTIAALPPPTDEPKNRYDVWGIESGASLPPTAAAKRSAIARFP
jgi:hypothetical protein